jgi:GT2 family glycosyltransferase
MTPPDIPDSPDCSPSAAHAALLREMLDHKRQDLRHCQGMLETFLEQERQREKQHPLPDGIRFGLDVPESHLTWGSGGSIHLGGWCFNRQGRAAQRVWVERNHQTIPCTTGWKREDVLQAFRGNHSVEPACGFNVEIEALPGINHIRIYASFSDSMEVLLATRTIVRMSRNALPQGQLEQDYASWVRLYDQVSTGTLTAIRKTWQRQFQAPLISVLLPTYNSDPRWLCEAIESVRRQSYPYWELCIADDASPAPHMRALLDHYQRKDGRIKVVMRERNGHIAAATNSALNLAQGAFCALLDHDDLLPETALHHVASEILRHPTCDLIYSDEDKVDCDGQRFDPYFKPDWNPELFCSHNCVSHLGVYRRSLLLEIGGFNESLSGSQDWDLALRFVARSSPERIRHIPKVLYHWRYLDSSTSKSIGIKPYAIEAGRKAIIRHLAQNKTAARVLDGTWQGSFRVQYLPPSPRCLSILIHGDGNTETMGACLNAINRFRDDSIAAIHVSWPENLSHPAPLPLGLPIHWQARPFGLSRSNALNALASEAQSTLLLFLDQDLRPTHAGWADELAGMASQPQTGASGAWLKHPDGFTQHAGVVLAPGKTPLMHCYRGHPPQDIGHMGRAHLIQRYSAVSGSCLATPKACFLAAGGFDAENFPELLAPIDYCLRLRRDQQRHCTWTPYATLTHHDTRPWASPDLQPGHPEWRCFRERWQNVIAHDPCFNPNLDAQDPRCFLAWPPRDPCAS